MAITPRRADELPHPSYALGRVDVMQHRDGGDDIKRRRLEVVGEHIADDELDAISRARIRPRSLDTRLVTVDRRHAQTTLGEVECEQSVSRADIECS